MDRDVTPEVAAALDLATQWPRYLIEAAFDSATIRLWTGVGALSALGETWTGTGRLMNISNLKDKMGVQTNDFVVTLAIVPTDDIPDAPDAFLEIARSEPFQGRKCRVYEAFFEPDGRTLIADPIPRRRGYIDLFEDVEIPGAAVLKITCVDRLARLETPVKRYYTPEDHKTQYPGDTFYDGVAALKNREIILK